MTTSFALIAAPPQEQVLMCVIELYYPNFRELTIHEFSPDQRGSSVKLANQSYKYISSQHDPTVPLGTYHPTREYRCENVEAHE